MIVLSQLFLVQLPQRIAHTHTHKHSLRLHFEIYLHFYNSGMFLWVFIVMEKVCNHNTSRQYLLLVSCVPNVYGHYCRLTLIKRVLFPCILLSSETILGYCITIYLLRKQCRTYFQNFDSILFPLLFVCLFWALFHSCYLC